MSQSLGFTAAPPSEKQVHALKIHLHGMSFHPSARHHELGDTIGFPGDGRRVDVAREIEVRGLANFSLDPVWVTFTLPKSGWSRHADGADSSAGDRPVERLGIGRHREEAPWGWPKDNLHPCWLRHRAEPRMNQECSTCC